MRNYVCSDIFQYRDKLLSASIPPWKWFQFNHLFEECISRHFFFVHLMILIVCDWLVNMTSSQCPVPVNWPVKLIPTSVDNPERDLGASLTPSAPAERSSDARTCREYRFLCNLLQTSKTGRKWIPLRVQFQGIVFNLAIHNTDNTWWFVRESWSICRIGDTRG